MLLTHFTDIYNELKNVLFSDSAVAGEAAGLAMGLVMLGTASPEAIEEMLQYAHETQHEKIIRGLAVGISLIMYGKEEKADALIDQLLDDKVTGGCKRMYSLLRTITGSCFAIWWYLHYCHGVQRYR